MSCAVAAGPAKPRVPTDDFNAQGLNYEIELTALHLGDFAHARLQRLSPEFVTLYSRYVGTFSRQCARFLPADKVALTRRQCSVESYKTNKYGMRVGASACVEYIDVPTGVFAAPEVYRAQVALEEEYGRDVLRNAGHGGVSEATLGAIDAANDLGDDIEKLLQTNACDGKGTRRFQENLIRFANTREGLKPAGEPSVETRLRHGASAVGTTDAGVQRLYAALVAANARGWLTNRYIPNSVEDVKVKRRDQQGRPALAEGYYLYDGGNGKRTVGKARLEFSEGLPRCLYFADAPGLCRHVSRRVVTAYERGSYENEAP